MKLGGAAGGVKCETWGEIWGAAGGVKREIWGAAGGVKCEIWGGGARGREM